jgi:hypothetical protein
MKILVAILVFALSGATWLQPHAEAGHVTKCFGATPDQTGRMTPVVRSSF